MDINAFIGKYGTEGTSMILKLMARQLEETQDAHGYTVDRPLVNEMADDLHKALESSLKNGVREKE